MVSEQNKLQSTWLASLFLSLLVTSVHIAAQDIEEVVIEAEMRDDSTLDVTESVEAFDLEDLETKQIKGFADIANNVPGLTSSPSGAQGLRFTLRGVGARDSQLGVESKVGLYVDGAFLGRASGLVFDIVDLEGVEVHKGPQGFHHGRNAIGGSINLITAKASVEEFTGRLNLTLGNFGRRNVTGIINIPISDTVAVRAAAFKNIQDGWVENTGIGVDFNGFDREGLRFSARWQPNEFVTVDYSYDQADFVTQPVFYQPINRNGVNEFLREDYREFSGNIAIWTPNSSFDLGPQLVFDQEISDDRFDSVNGNIKEIENSTTEADGHSLNIRWDWSDQHSFEFIGTHRTSDVVGNFYFYPSVVSHDNLTRALTGGGLGQLIGMLEGEQYSPVQTYDGGLDIFRELDLVNIARKLGTPESLAYADDLEILVAAARPPSNMFLDPPVLGLPGATSLAQEWLQYTSLSLPSYPASFAGPSQPYRLRTQMNQFFASPPGGLASLRDHKQFSLEFKQSGFFLDERLKYSVGLYYFNERTGNGQQLPEGELFGDILELLDFGRTDGENPLLVGFSLISLNDLDTDHIGLYMNTDYTPLIWDERLTISFGLRYSRDDRSLYRQSLTAVTLDLRGPPDIDSERWESVDPRLKLAYDLTDEVTGYVSVTRGYRAGNFNVEARRQPPRPGEDPDAIGVFDLAFEKETLIAYEVGAKGSLWDGLAEFEFATFYYDTKDGQETVVYPSSPITRQIVNADGFAYGIELDTTWYLTENLTWTVNYALLRSGSNTYATPFIFDANKRLDITNPDAEIGGIAEVEIYQNLLRACRGELRRVETDFGRCVERKSNFGAPVNSWDSALDYRLPTDFGELYFHLGYAYKDGHFVNDARQVDARSLWDLRVQSEFELDMGVMRVALWSQNLFDNEYQVAAFEFERFAYNVAAYGQPRTYGIDLIFEWF